MIPFPTIAGNGGLVIVGISITPVATIHETKVSSTCEKRGAICSERKNLGSSHALTDTVEHVEINGGSSV